MPLDTALGRSPGGTRKSSCREVRPPGAGKSSDFNWKPGATVAVRCNPPAQSILGSPIDPAGKPSYSASRIILTARNLEIDASGSTRGLDFSSAVGFVGASPRSSKLQNHRESTDQVAVAK